MAVKVKPYRIAPLSQIILAKLYEQHVNNDVKDRYSVDEIRELFSIHVSRNLIISSIELLMKSRDPSSPLINRRGNKSSGTDGYCIGSTGIQVVERALMKKDDAIAHYILNGDGVIDEIAGIEGNFITRDEVEDFDEWAPLSIEKDSPEFKGAVNAIEEVISMAGGDNGFSIHYPDQKEGILRSLKDGLDWLKNRVVSKNDIGSLLLRPLRWISVTFTGNVLGEAAKRAAQKILDLITF